MYVSLSLIFKARRRHNLGTETALSHPNHITHKRLAQGRTVSRQTSSGRNPSSSSTTQQRPTTQVRGSQRPLNIPPGPYVASQRTSRSHPAISRASAVGNGE